MSFLCKIAGKIQSFILNILTIVSFLLLPFYLGYVVYFSIVCYDICKVVVGSVLMYTLIHLNKSL